MESTAQQLADTILSIDSQDEIEAIIKAKADEIGADFKTLYRHTNNAYHAKYEQGKGPGVSPEACSDINVR